MADAGSALAALLPLGLLPPKSSRPTGTIDSLEEWFAALTQPAALVELGILLACVMLAWLMVSLARRALGNPDQTSILFGRNIIDGVLFPLLLLFFAYSANVLLSRMFALAVFKVAIPVLLALALIRLGVKVLQVVFKDAPLVRTLERSISWIA